MSRDDAPLVECVPNFSEGRDANVVRAIAEAAAREGALLLDLTRDTDHNRSVLTMAGTPDCMARAAVAAAGVAAKHIDLRKHMGVHPRIGAADVVPFIPLRNYTMEQCAELARDAAREHWRRNGVPCYFYEASAVRRDRTRLEQIRKGGFRVLREIAATDESRRPDVGGPALHESAGASVFGARPFLVAYNVNLATNDVALARAIAREIRASNGGFKGVKALGLYLESRDVAQVSTNVTDFHVTPVHLVFQAIERAAARAGVRIAGSELIGLIPRACIEMAAGVDFHWERWDETMVLETRLELAASGRLQIPGLIIK